MIFTESPEINPGLTLDDLPGTFGEAVGASAQSALYNSPVWQLKRTWDDSFNAGGPMLDYETARSKAKAAGVSIQLDPKGMTEGALDMLIERKRFQARTQDAIARGPQGFAANSAYFLSGLGAAMLDPINLASAFIPVARGVGMTADIALAGRLGEAGAAVTTAGRAAARIRVGAVEGAVGQAMLEPLTAYRASQEQEDYGITDTLLNVGFGAALGAVAHAGLGALGDRAVAAQRGRKAGDLIDAAKTAPEVFARDSAAAKLQAADLETNSAVFRSEIAAAADGRKMDNSVLVHEAPKLVDRIAPDLRPATAEEVRGLLAGKTEKPGGVDPARFAEQGYEYSVGKVPIDAIRANEDGVRYDSTVDTARAADYAARSPDSVPPIVVTPSKDGTVLNVLDGGHRISAARIRGDKSIDVVLYTTKRSRAFQDDLRNAIDPVKVQEAAAASHLPENDVHFDAQARAEVDGAVAQRAADTDPAEAVLRATQEAQTELATLSQQLGLDPEKNAAMRSADDMASIASRYSKAIEAFASCQVRS